VILNWKWLKTEKLCKKDLKMIKSFIFFFLSCQRCSGDYALSSHCGAPATIPGDFVWDLWWLKWQWSIYISPGLSDFLSANHHSIFFYTYLSLPLEVCNSDDKAAHYHILGPQAGVFVSDSAFGWLQNKEVSLPSLRSIMLRYSSTSSHSTRELCCHTLFNFYLCPSIAVMSTIGHVGR
jgi:hypothetical protein